MAIGFLTRPWLTADRMLQLGRCVQLMRELRMTDSSFFIYMRMKPSMFDEILDGVGPESKRVTPRKAFEPGVKLARMTRAYQKRQGWLCLNNTDATEARWS